MNSIIAYKNVFSIVKISRSGVTVEFVEYRLSKNGILKTTKTKDNLLVGDSIEIINGDAGPKKELEKKIGGKS